MSIGLEFITEDKFVWSRSISAKPEVVAWRGDPSNGTNKMVAPDFMDIQLSLV